jgi:hypothetical protein
VRASHVSPHRLRGYTIVPCGIVNQAQDEIALLRILLVNPGRPARLFSRRSSHWSHALTGLSKSQEQQLFVSSAALAWVFPGLGYIHRGQTARGLMVMVSVLSLIFVGTLVGGIQVCDAARNPVSGLAQRASLPGVILNFIAAANRPAGAGDGFTQVMIDNTGGRPEEVGLIFTAVAGALNLMAIIGSLTPLPKELAPLEEKSGEPVKPDAQGGTA